MPRPKKVVKPKVGRPKGSKIGKKKTYRVKRYDFKLKTKITLDVDKIMKHFRKNYLDYTDYPVTPNLLIRVNDWQMNHRKGLEIYYLQKDKSEHLFFTEFLKAEYITNFGELQKEFNKYQQERFDYMTDLVRKHIGKK